VTSCGSQEIEAGKAGISKRVYSPIIASFIVLYHQDVFFIVYSMDYVLANQVQQISPLVSQLLQVLQTIHHAKEVQNLRYR
jgi:hypothetical protein